MKHVVLSVFILFTLSANAQTPSVIGLADLVKMHSFDRVVAYADSLGYNKGQFVPQIGDMYDYNLYTFTRKDTSVVNSYFTYSAGHHYAMNQGPLSVSLTYSTSSAAEFDKLVAEIKALGAEEIDAKENSPVHNYQYERITISCFENINTPELKYTIGLNCIYW